MGLRPVAAPASRKRVIAVCRQLLPLDFLESFLYGPLYFTSRYL
jgi:hypothetical protein